jgi:hypothetical protein
LKRALKVAKEKPIQSIVIARYEAIFYVEKQALEKVLFILFIPKIKIGNSYCRHVVKWLFRVEPFQHDP